jgi:hypothetical protein
VQLFVDSRGPPFPDRSVLILGGSFSVFILGVFVATETALIRSDVSASFCTVRPELVCSASQIKPWPVAYIQGWPGDAFGHSSTDRWSRKCDWISASQTVVVACVWGRA